MLCRHASDWIRLLRSGHKGGSTRGAHRIELEEIVAAN
jgi:hypothetical protein